MKSAISATQLSLSNEETAKFRTLGVSSVTALSILAPSSFEDRRLSHELTHNVTCVIDATIEHVVRTPKTLKITFFAHNLDITLEGVIFSPKPYMVHQFPKAARGFFSGKAVLEQGRWQMMQPVKITGIGTI
ncbi:MAG: ATP-dependent DNA helicase RecG, partial [Sulfuricurvum sp.]|nr:ATP-dependent DNA helicase RecG [Sulfuricurvum sp.]